MQKRADSDLLEVKVARRLDEAQDIVSLEFVPASGSSLLAFEAGSHVDVHVAPGVVRQYSICNDPRESHRYVFGILREPQSRGGSATIHAHSPKAAYCASAARATISG